MILASATFGASSPVMFLNCREDARQDRSPLALLWMPAPQLATPAKRTPPVVWKRTAGVTPIPTLPALSMVIRVAVSVRNNSLPVVPVVEGALKKPTPRQKLPPP